MGAFWGVLALLFASQAHAMGAKPSSAPMPDPNQIVAASVGEGCVTGFGQQFAAPTQSPQWAAADDGKPIDLVQFYVRGPLDSVRRVFERQGWSEALASSFEDDLAYIGSILIDLQSVIQRMPVSTESLCGQGMVTAYERDNNPFAGRRHFRIFNAGQDEQGRSVWAISASLDTGIRFDFSRPNQGFLNHASEADEDLERDRVLQEFFDQDAVASINTLTLSPTGFAEDNNAYSADGKVYDLLLRQ